MHIADVLTGSVDRLKFAVVLRLRGALEYGLKHALLDQVTFGSAPGFIVIDHRERAAKSDRPAHVVQLGLESANRDHLAYVKCHA